MPWPASNNSHDMIDVGDYGERLVQNFFDSNISKFYTFPNAKSKDKAEFADVVVWSNRQLFVVEVKSRDSKEGTASLESWAAHRISQAVSQIDSAVERCERGETINLHNDFFHVELDHDGVTNRVGIVILAFDGFCDLLPTDAVADLYDRPFPIHVLTWDDLQALSAEIDTVPDLFYYLQDRFSFAKSHDIPLGVEEQVIGYYKLHENEFPRDAVDFRSESFWQEYKTSRAADIQRRAQHGEYSNIIDSLESAFSDQRKQFSELPIGLYFSWEIGSQTRRARAYVGEKLHRVRRDFEDGKHSRQFSICNLASGNWHVYYFSKDSRRNIGERLLRLVELKLIKEVHINAFEFGVYGFGFRVSSTLPFRLIDLPAAVVIGADEASGYTESDLREAFEVWGTQKYTSAIQIQEFPDSDL